MSRASPSDVARQAITVAREHEYREGLIARMYQASLDAAAAAMTAAYQDRTPLALDNVYLRHNPAHYGETPHLIRHMLRGGRYLFIDNEDRKKAIQERQGKLGLSNLSGPQLQSELDKRNVKEAKLAWGEVEDQLKLIYEPLGLSGPSVKPLYQVGPKVGHTGIHHYQIAPTVAEFTRDLYNELAFVSCLRRSAGYDAIKAEVAELSVPKPEEFAAIKAEVVVPGKATFKHSLIVWCRDNSDDASRAPSDAMWNACVSGAVLAVAESAHCEVGEVAVVLMGDKNSSVPRSWKLGMHTINPVWDARGHHVAGASGVRPIFEQILYLSALVEQSGAGLAVGQRSGLLDLVALAGGIAICQFLPAQETQRLNQVFQSGCGMGGNVILQPEDQAQSLMMNACLMNMGKLEQLKREIKAFELARRIAATEKKAAKAAAAAAAAAAVSTDPVQRCEDADKK
jgi:hypothetical protein